MLDADVRSSGARVEIHALEKRFGENLVLSRLDLSVRDGEFLSIVGKSGCGKSTLLRLIAGLERPSGGRVMIDSAAPEDSLAAVRIMFQEPRLLPWASVIDNVKVGVADHPDGASVTDASRRALVEVQLPDKGRDWPALLSGGQKQRVALARALVSRPRLLLLDEPLGALDALTRLVMQKLILEVKQEAGFTAVLVTHDVAEAVALSDRVIVLDGGRIAEDLRIDLPHPRPRASAALAGYEAHILDAIFGREPSG